MPTQKSAKLLNRIFIAGLVLLAFALRVYKLGEHSLWYDELLELDIAQGPFSQILPQLDRHAAMPLDYFVLFGWLRLGHQEAWVRFPALFFGTLTVPLTYLLAARLFNRTVGYLAAILMAAASFSISYSQEVRPYALLTLMVLVGYWGLWQVYKTRDSSYWGMVLLGLVGATLTHYFALFMLPPMGVFVAVQQVRYHKQQWFWKQTAYFGLCLLFTVITIFAAGRFWRVYNVGFGLAKVVSQPQVLTLSAAEKPNKGTGPPREPGFFVEKVLMSLATIEPRTLLLFNFFSLVAVLSLLRPRQRYRGAIVLLLGWLIVPILLIYIFLLQRGTFFAIRYILYTLPAYLILVAYGIELVATRLSQAVHKPYLNNLMFGGWLLLGLWPLVSSQIRSLEIHYSLESREDWRAVGQLLWANAAPDDVVIAVKAEPVINWYYPPARAPFGTFGRSEPIWQAMRKHQRRWFVLSSYSFKRDKGLRDWLREQQAVVIPIDRRVVVYFHREGATAGEMLVQVRSFSLPQKARTYAHLAEQFKTNGDLETSRLFYQRAVELAESPSQKADYQTRLASLINP